MISQKIADLLNNIFEDSEEEIIEEINDAKKQLEEAEKRLKALKKRKKKKQVFFKAWHINVLFAAILMFLVFFLAYSFYSSYTPVFRYSCKEKNDCKDCNIAASCVQFEELGGNGHNIHFEVENRNNISGECYAQLYLVFGQTLLENRTIKLGTLEKGETKRFVYEGSLPTGDTEVSVEPFCDWK